MSNFLFTSESVSEGHPDKVADQISDAVLDAILEQDPTGRVAAETLVSTGLVVMAGEITTKANVDYGRVARETIRAIGYNDPELRFDADGCAVMVCYGRQSPDIAQGVDRASDDYLNQGAGDQGLMFGYACDETPSLMPYPIYYAHRLVQRQSEVRRDGRLPFLRPDAKSQVTVRYVDGKPDSVETVVLSTQHHPSMNEKQDKLAEAVIEEIIKPVIPAHMLKNTRFLVNPTGRFEIGGPHGDAGLTGRKIIVDTYGGAAPHGGGAFSGKDPSKVDRSAAYAARYVAKNVVAAGIARQCQVQVAYAIGVAKPMNVTVYTEGTGKISDEKIAELVERALRPASEGHHPDAGPAAPDLPQDRRLRPLRPRRARVHVGSDGQGGGAAGRGGAVGARHRPDPDSQSGTSASGRADRGARAAVRVRPCAASRDCRRRPRRLPHRPASPPHVPARHCECAGACACHQRRPRQCGRRHARDDQARRGSQGDPRRERHDGIPVAGPANAVAPVLAPIGERDVRRQVGGPAVRRRRRHEHLPLPRRAAGQGHAAVRLPPLVGDRAAGEDGALRSHRRIARLPPVTGDKRQTSRREGENS